MFVYEKINEFVYSRNLNAIVYVATMIQCILNLINVHTVQLKIENCYERDWN